jgi:hypothetical protein
VPRPDSGFCDDDPLNIVSVTFDNPMQGTIVVRESLTDEYGEPLSDEQGEPIYLNEYQLLTDNGGETWTLADD